MSPIKVLIVEDEGIVAMDLFGTLGRLGYEVAGRTAHGEEALALARREAPDVILMDIRLAGKKDGIEAARDVRAELGIPVIFVTAHADDATLARARTVEPYGYIVKPFDDLSVRTSVELACYRRKAEREREAAASAARLGGVAVGPRA
ncbi:MAG: hypothetical protein QOD77_242 [Thermoplasmata archaeon]|jgi:CheY-like chemotaxis protein|nr:hypothetical protein [Thermoplasmata archaeon]